MKEHWTMVLSLLCAGSLAQAADPVPLPPPQTDGGMPLMQALKNRASSREFSPKKIPDQVLSSLLWAGFGINRPDSGKRTAPSARNWQEIDLYVLTPDGAFLYDAKDNALKPIVAEDVRALAGVQPFVKEAPLNLILVADYARMGDGDETMKLSAASVCAGAIAQNVYLFCASEGLAAVVRASVDKTALAEKLGLSPSQRIILAQTVGYPKD